MDDYLDSRRLSIDLEIANALRKLRPHLVKTESFRWRVFGSRRDRRAVADAIVEYLSCVVDAHFHFQVASDVMFRDFDIEAFVESALQDAKTAADSSPWVTKNADANRQVFVDGCRVGRLKEWQRRAIENRLIHSVNYIEDPREQEEIRAEWAAIRAEQEEKAAAELAETQEAICSETGGREMQWEDIEMSFLSEERLQITCAGKMETRNYAEMGFQDGRNGKPKSAWTVFLALAASKGTLRDVKGRMDRSKVEKRIEEIRRILQRHFGISADPLPPVKRISGWVARFKIGLGPSYDA
jgi:hypothetical protein